MLEIMLGNTVTAAALAIVAAVLSDGFSLAARLLWVTVAIVVVAWRIALRRTHRHRDRGGR